MLVTSLKKNTSKGITRKKEKRVHQQRTFGGLTPPLTPPSSSPALEGLQKLSIKDHKVEKVKAEIKKEEFSSFDIYNFWNELNVSKEEYLPLKCSSINKNIILQNADKCNSFVLVSKEDFIKRMKEFLSDVSKFKEITC